MSHFSPATRMPCLYELLTGEVGEARSKALSDLRKAMQGRKTMRADAKAMSAAQEATTRLLALEAGR